MLAITLIYNNADAKFWSSDEHGGMPTAGNCQPLAHYFWHRKILIHMFLALTNDTAAHHSALQLLSMRV